MKLHDSKINDLPNEGITIVAMIRIVEQMYGRIRGNQRSHCRSNFIFKKLNLIILKGFFLIEFNDG